MWMNPLPKLRTNQVVGFPFNHYYFMMIQGNILVWNIRGGGNPELFRNIKQSTDIHRPDIIVVVEPRVDPDRLQKTFFLLGYSGFCFSPVQGFAGGIILGWRQPTVDVRILQITTQFIHTEVTNAGCPPWFFTAVYASPSETNRRDMWRELTTIANNMHGAWMLAGDFNDIAHENEKKGGGPPPYAKITRFVDNINNCQLLDLGSVGSRFTWKGQLFHDGFHIYKRLDRALCNDTWRLRFNEAYVKVLAKIDYSDHHPLLIVTAGRQPIGNNYKFRFESMWLTNDTYQDFLENCWSSGLKIDQNLHHLEDKLNGWKHHTFGAIRNKKKELLARIEGIQNKQSRGRERAYLCKLEKKLQADLNLINFQEELCWFQRSRATWLIGGDRNTRYYHLKATARKRRNQVLALRKHDGSWEFEEANIKNMLNEHYKNIFKDTGSMDYWIQTATTYPVIKDRDLVEIAAPVTNEEVKHAMFLMAPWKAPGPDGFPAGFYQHSWDTVGQQVCDFVKSVWIDPTGLGTVNNTDICLIPKVDKPEFVDQFRPISLCNSLYKVVSKIIVERLKQIIPILISPFQSGFVPGRKIQENIVIAQEMVHSMNKLKGKLGYFAIKVDLSKAYDMLKWSFIERTMNEIGLPRNITQLIMSAITSVKTNVNWNGQRSDYFQPQKGIRQGDPISPYIFVMCIDKLSHMISDMAANGSWRGLKAGRNGPTISHLMFADDLLLFGQATVDQINCVMSVLKSFCAMSGQQVNLSKTTIMFSNNVQPSTRHQLANLSGFKTVNTLGKYLGIPLTGRTPTRADYHYLIEQMQAKLAGWKARQLSKAGRVTLTKSVLEALPIYPMMAGKLPMGVLHDIERIQRNFIWGDEAGHRKIHAVNWNVVTQPKSLGGLGIRKLTTMNTACLLKLGWDLRSNKNNLWCKVMKGKYQRQPIDDKVWVTKSTDSSLWKNIAPLEDFFKTHEYWAIGNGQRVNAWHQKWLSCEHSIINQNVHVPPQYQHFCVADLVTIDRNWNFDLLKNWLPEEILNQLHAVPPPTEDQATDICAWPGSYDGSYKVTAGYNILCNFNFADAPDRWKKIWKLQTSERVRHHMWLIAHDRLLTNARKARMNMGPADCPQCAGVPETLLHAIRDCSAARTTWMHLIKPVYRNRFFTSDLPNWIAFNLSSELGNNSTIDWSAVWANSCHLIWTWRNKLIHEPSFVMPWQQWNLAVKEAQEYKQISAKQVIRTAPARNIRQTQWYPPAAGYIKLNTDGSCFQECGIAGCGGIFRDSNGSWLLGYSKSLGYCNAYVAELWGVYQGLMIASDNHYNNLVVELDAANIVTLLQKNKLGKCDGWSIMRRIGELIRHQQLSILFTHTFKEANMCAHLLAQAGSRQIEDLIIFDAMPLGMSKAFREDLRGVTHHV